MKLLILTEGGSKSGFGHITRTSAIAAAVRKLSPRSEVQFLISGDTRAKVYAKTAGLKFVSGNWIKNWNPWEVTAKSANALLIDSYAPLAVCKKISAANPNCFWMDDYNRLRYPGGHVLHSGRDYVILRRAFQKTSPRFQIRKHIKNVLILLGGTGTRQTAEKIMLAILSQAMAKDIMFHWVAPQDTADPKIPNLKIWKNLSAEKMVQLISKSDLAVSASGQTLFELAVLGVPTIAVQTMRNQRENVRVLTKRGSLQFAGYGFNTKTIKNILIYFKKLTNSNQRRKLSENAKKSVDRHGVDRIARLILRSA